MRLRLSTSLLLLVVSVDATPGCIKRSFEEVEEAIVCVCNSTYCDDIEPLGDVDDGTAVLYWSDRGGRRMDRSVVKTNSVAREMNIRFDALNLHQEVLGFGGAFTDSAGINILSLPPAAQELLLKQYYGPTGAEYTLGRIPMASTDFSTREYSYLDKSGDFNLSTFVLASEDRIYKIPLIKRAMQLQKDSGGLKFYASPWSAPAWMKSNNAMKGGGRLRGFEGGQYYVAWAQYFVKFLEAYLAEGIKMWAVTVQNEPTSGADVNYGWQTMYFSAAMERDFIKGQLGPALKSSAAGKDVNIIMLDDQRFLLPGWADIVFEDEYVSSITQGIGVHWYEDLIYPASALSTTHEKHPDKFILATESCEGWLDIGRGVLLGDFSRAESYAHSIIEDMNNFVGGWTDWNLALDPTGGPTWVANNVDAPIIVYKGSGEFLKQPMYYAMAHFSKFLKPGSRRASMTMPTGLPDQVEALGALLPGDRRAVVLLNRNSDKTATVSIEDAERPGRFIYIDAPPHSIVTAIWA